jgi:hypothetical protein
VVRSVTHIQQLGSWLKDGQSLNLQQPAARQKEQHVLVPVRSDELDGIDARARRDKCLRDVVLRWRSRGGLHGAAGWIDPAGYGRSDSLR